MKELLGCFLILKEIALLLGICDQNKHLLLCSKCACKQQAHFGQQLLECDSSEILNPDNDLLKNAAVCAQNSGFNISLKLATNKPVKIPWPMIGIKPNLTTLDLRNTMLSCSCENAWIHWFARLKRPSLVKDPDWAFQCPECTLVTTQMMFHFPYTLLKPHDDQCLMAERTRQNFSDFVERNCAIPRHRIWRLGSQIFCGITDTSTSGNGCVATNIRSFFKKNKINSTLVTNVPSPTRCEISASVDISNATTADSGWLICTQNSSHIPSALITRIAVHDIPIVLEVLDFRISPQDYHINITLASADPMKFSWFYAAGFRSNFLELWEILPNRTSQFLLEIYNEGFYHGWMTTTLSAEFYDPDVKCNGGDYVVQACNKFGCVSRRLYVNTSRPERCAKINGTFFVTRVFCAPGFNLTSDYRLMECPNEVHLLHYDTDPLVADTNTSNNVFVYVTVGVGFMLTLCVLLSVCVAMFLVRERRNRAVRKLSRKCRRGSNFDGTELDVWRSNAGSSLRVNHTYVSFLKLLRTKNEIMVIPSENIQIVRELGEGAFGCVFLVQRCSSVVVGKTSRKSSVSSSTIPLLQSDSRAQSPRNTGTTLMAMKLLKFMSPDKLEDLESEARVLTQLSHPSIVQFHGITVLENKGFALLFEFMANGDLVHYLRDHNPDLVDSSKNVDAETLRYPDLLRISLQVASGLAYLADRFLVHRDLAARNCLVAENGSVKISDFGMTRDLCATDYYKMGVHTLVPLRWLPPECVLYRKFTTESDMWSFGVLSYEIWSYGQIPWYAYSNSEVMDIVKTAQVLEKPDRCPQEIYDSLIVRCCQAHPSDRLTAREAEIFLESLLERELDYISFCK